MRVAIVGGGIAGLSLGYYLAKAGHHVKVYEKKEELGGLSRSFILGDAFLEEYYHHIFLTDICIIDLIKELALEEKLIWEESKMAVYCDGKIYSFGTPFDLLRFKPFSFIDKIRFAFSGLYLIKSNDYGKFEKITAKEFLLKTAGRNVYKKVWEPLLTTKFGEEDYNKIAADWLHARVRPRGKSKSGLFEREKLGYLNGSFKVLFDELEKRINNGSGGVLKHTPVERLDVNKNGNIEVHSNVRTEMFDACCLCVPNPVIEKIAGHLFNKEYVNTYLKSIKYRAVLCVVLIIKGSLSPYYWINISQHGVPFTGLLEHTNLISKGRYSENDIIYLGRYISPEEKQYNMNDDDLIDLYSNHITDIFPKFSKSMIKQIFIFRDLFAQPVITMECRDKIPSAISPVKNIFINNTTQTYPIDRGLDAGTRKSLELSRTINNMK